MRGISTQTSIAAAQKSLDALWLRSQVISDNIANIDTPGYKSKTVEFEKLLERMLSTSAPAGGAGLESRLSSLRPKITQNDDVSLKEDGNSVDVEEQNIELIRTILQYETVSTAVSSELSRMKYAVSAGGSK